MSDARQSDVRPISFKHALTLFALLSTFTFLYRDDPWLKTWSKPLPNQGCNEPRNGQNRTPLLPKLIPPFAFPFKRLPHILDLTHREIMCCYQENLLVLTLGTFFFRISLVLIITFGNTYIIELKTFTVWHVSFKSVIRMGLTRFLKRNKGKKVI